MFETLEIIGTYTRADALRDGVLSDVTAEFARHRFWCPVAVTASVFVLGLCEGRELKAQKLNIMIIVDTDTKVHSRSSSPAFGNAMLGAVPSVVYNEDCVTALKRYADNHFDLAIVDPPYGFRTEKTGILNFRKGKQEKEWNVAPTAEYFDELKRVSKNQIVWGGNYFPELWVNGCRGFIYWHKGNPVPNFADGELAWTSFDRNAKQCDYRYYGNLEGKSSAGDKFHPTQKPIYLYEWILKEYAEEGNLILDTHLGSGSSRIACFKGGFNFVGFEIDTEYYEKQEKRFKDFVSQLRMF